MLRAARPDEIDRIRDLMVQSVAGLSGGFYDDDQTERAARFITAPDPDIIADGTYYVVEIAGELAACGGWSRRRKLFTGSPDQELLSAAPLTPGVDAAKIRAFFVHPNFARRGLARQLYEACEVAARAEGFTAFELMATLPGVPLYRSLGFEGSRPEAMHLPDGTTLPGVPMTRRI